MWNIDLADIDGLDSKKTWMANEQRADQTLTPLIARERKVIKPFM